MTKTQFLCSHRIHNSVIHNYNSGLYIQTWILGSISCFGFVCLQRTPKLSSCVLQNLLYFSSGPTSYRQFVLSSTTEISLIFQLKIKYLPETPMYNVHSLRMTSHGCRNHKVYTKIMIKWSAILSIQWLWISYI